MSYTLKNLHSDQEFFISAYTDINDYAKPTEGISESEFIISKEDTSHLFSFLRDSPTPILKEMENNLQALCNRGGRPLLTALLDINLCIDFAKEAMIASSSYSAKNMREVFIRLSIYLSDAKKLGSNIIALEGYEKNV